MALMVLRIVQESGVRLADLWADYENLPSKQWGLKVREKRDLAEVAGFNEAVAKAEERFAGKGRVFVRYSGTENKLRILVEGEDVNLVEKHGEILAKIIEKEIGA
jgi:phosphoglucosamine mutase